MIYFEFFPINVFDAIIGFFFGFLLFAITEVKKKPQLKFEIVNGETAERKINGKEYKWKHLSAKVINFKRSKLFRYFDKTAENTTCFVIAKDPSSRHALLKIKGRWSTGREPYDYIADKVDIGLAVITQREVIPPGEESEINVAIKFEGDRHFYLFNNESYLPADDGGPFRHTRLKFDNSHLLACVVVWAGGVEYKKEFIIQNPNLKLNDFRLERTDIKSC